MTVPFLMGRLLYGGFFLYNGVNHFKQRGKLSQYAASKKIPAPDAAVSASGVALLLGGSSLILGVKPKFGIAAVIGFLAAVSPAMHDFWRLEDPGQRAGEMINFSKNMALLGAALALTGIEEPWPASLSTARPTRLQRARMFARACLSR